MTPFRHEMAVILLVADVPIPSMALFVSLELSVKSFAALAAEVAEDVNLAKASLALLKASL